MSELEQFIPYFPWDCIKAKCIPELDLRQPFPTGLCFQIVFITAGAGIVEFNGQRLAFSASTIFCLNEQDSLQLISPGTIEVKGIHFDPSWINPSFTFTNLRSSDFQTQNAPEVQDKYFLIPFLQRNENYLGLISCTLETFRDLREKYDAIAKQLNEHPDDYWPCRTRSYLIQCLILISDAYSRQGPPLKVDQSIQVKEDSDIITEIITYLHNNYAEDISIQDLEKQFALNRTTLAERFKVATGQPIMSYLRNLRLKTAAALLQETFVPVNEICSRVGFNDLSHFGRTFREVYSLTPTEFRDEFCWVGK